MARRGSDAGGGGLPWEERTSPGRRRAAYGLAAVAGAIAVAATLSFLAASPAPEGAPAPAAQAAPEEGADRSQWFLGEENFPFLSDEGLRAFESSCYAWLLAQGMDEGRYVYCCAEDVSSEGSAWRAYVRTPHDSRYYLVTYDVAGRSFAFEASGEPPTLAARQKHANESEAALAASSAGGEEEGPDSGGEEPGGGREEPASPYDASRNIPVTDADALRAHLPDEAAAALPEAVEEYARMREFSTQPGMCSVYPDSFGEQGGLTVFEVLCFDEDRRAVRLSVEYDPSVEMFGMSLI